MKETHTTLPAKLENLPLFIAAVTAHARRAGFGDDRINAIELAVEEALVNVFNYAYPAGPGDATVWCRSDNPNTLTIRIEDSGAPFDSLALPAPDTAAGLDDRPIGGLGVFLIRQFMDDARYARQDDRNILTLVARKDSKKGVRT